MATAFNFSGKHCYWWTEPNRGIPPSSVGLAGFPLLNCRHNRRARWWSFRSRSLFNGLSAPEIRPRPTMALRAVGPATLCTVPWITIVFTNAYRCGRPNAYQGRMGSGDKWNGFFWEFLSTQPGARDANVPHHESFLAAADVFLIDADSHPRHSRGDLRQRQPHVNPYTGADRLLRKQG